MTLQVMSEGARLVVLEERRAREAEAGERYILARQAAVEAQADVDQNHELIQAEPSP